jgi:hypothetical protein
MMVTFDFDVDRTRNCGTLAAITSLTGKVASADNMQLF